MVESVYIKARHTRPRRPGRHAARSFRRRPSSAQLRPRVVLECAEFAAARLAVHPLRRERCHCLLLLERQLLLASSVALVVASVWSGEFRQHRVANICLLAVIS